ncbi:hypothetical protein HK097_006227 [Rhizophlyctis rosea]|uniref:GH26 domain-containing protein n=1 Tax=Rhizophlyctis rosea TaxID=64517 RepID=A0AAD5X268_9FUNG|nr:hypothetical protein HK097_006227 [Rhizophlyctis rosea]
MGHRSFCAFLFWMKVLLATTLAFLGLGYFSLLVYQRRMWAVGNPKIWVPPPPKDFIDIPADGSCAFTPDAAKGQRNRLEPEDGHFLFGFDLQWNNEQPPAIARKMGRHKPAVYNTFININETDFQKTSIDWMAQQAQEADAMLEITLLPNDPRPDRATPLQIENIPDDTLYAFAMQMKRVNSEYGVPVFLRYVHEMNAMVWSPNIGEAYPWGENTANTKPVTPETATLDTNGDGLISGTDDPYMPYWPGPEYVDWVGFSLYQYDHTGEPGRQTIARPGFVDFTNPLTGVDSKNVGVGAQTRLEFYVRFAQNFNKPFMFSETGAAYHVPGNDAAHGMVPLPANPDETNINIKREWWRGMFSLINTGRYNNIKLACWFEELKNEPAFWDGRIQLEKDYRITWDAPVLNAFQADLDNPQYNAKLRWADDYEWDCTGKLRAKS